MWSSIFEKWGGTILKLLFGEGIKLPKSYNSKPRGLFSLKLRRSLYGLKQSGRIWYNRLSEYLLKEGYKNDATCPCVFVKRSKNGFSIIAVYVDDLNIVGTCHELEETAKYLMKEFEMKDLGKTKLCLGLQIEHLDDGIFVHQSKDRKSTRLNSSHITRSRMPSSA